MTDVENFFYKCNSPCLWLHLYCGIPTRRSFPDLLQFILSSLRPRPMCSLFHISHDISESAVGMVKILHWLIYRNISLDIEKYEKSKAALSQIMTADRPGGRASLDAFQIWGPENVWSQAHLDLRKDHGESTFWKKGGWPALAVHDGSLTVSWRATTGNRQSVCPGEQHYISRNGFF